LAQGEAAEKCPVCGAPAVDSSGWSRKVELKGAKPLLRNSLLRLSENSSLCIFVQEVSKLLP